MKKRTSALLVFVIAISVIFTTALAASGNPDDEIALLRSRIKTVHDIDDAVYSQLEAAVTQKFKDVKKGDWYMSVMCKLVGLGSIDGITPETLVPGGTITRAMFIKMFIRAMLGENAVDGITPDFNHWAARDIKKAEEIGILAEKEYNLSNIERPITRGEMSKLVVRAYRQFEDDPMTLDECRPLSKVITDYNRIEEEYKSYVLITFGAGIITGFPDGHFGADETASRAHAAAIVIRYLDKRERAKVNIPASREPMVLRWDDPHRPLPIEGDTFVKADGTEVVLKIGPAGVLGENQNCDLYGGMAYPDGSLVEHGLLGTKSLGHLGETYLVDKYGEGHWWPEWLQIMNYYSNKAYEEVKNPQDGQTYGKWFVYRIGQWCWTGPVNM